MRTSICEVAALCVLAAAVAAAAPASASDCLPVTSVVAPHHHRVVHHTGVPLHRHRSHHHLRVASVRRHHHTSGSALAYAAVQNRPAIVKTSLTGNACAVHHYSGGSDAPTLRPGIMDVANNTVFDAVSGLVSSTPSIFDADFVQPSLIGAQPGPGSGGDDFLPVPGIHQDLVIPPGFPGGSTPTPPGSPGFFRPNTPVVPPSGPLPPPTASVPEPDTWALMIFGFAFVGFAARRRRATASGQAATASGEG